MQLTLYKTGDIKAVSSPQKVNIVDIRVITDSVNLMEIHRDGTVGMEFLQLAAAVVGFLGTFRLALAHVKGLCLDDFLGGGIIGKPHGQSYNGTVIADTKEK